LYGYEWRHLVDQIIEIFRRRNISNEETKIKHSSKLKYACTLRLVSMRHQ
jgi:hypothetical protein